MKSQMVHIQRSSWRSIPCSGTTNGKPELKHEDPLHPTGRIAYNSDTFHLHRRTKAKSTNIAPTEQKPSLLNIALTCKRLNSLAMPCIYEMVIFRSQEDMHQFAAFASLATLSLTHARLVKHLAIGLTDEQDFSRALDIGLEYEDQFASEIKSFSQPTI